MPQDKPVVPVVHPDKPCMYCGKNSDEHWLIGQFGEFPLVLCEKAPRWAS